MPPPGTRGALIIPGITARVTIHSCYVATNVATNPFSINSTMYTYCMEKNFEKIRKKENNRIFNLVWVAIFIIFGLTLFLHPLENAESSMFVTTFIAVCIVEILIIIIPKRNNFVSAFLLFIIALALNTSASRLYDLTWFYYPKLDASMTSYLIEVEPWFSAAGWVMSVLTALSFVYMFCSCLAKLFSKKSHCLVCFLVSLLLVGASAYLGFSYLPLNFVLPQEELTKNFSNEIKITLVSEHSNGQEISTVLESDSFLVHIEGLPGGKRYGLRIINESNGESTISQTKFQYYRDKVWSGDLAHIIAFGDTYIIQVVAQEKDNLIVVGEKSIKVTELVFQPYEAGKKYPCELWLTLGDSSEKLRRIEEPDSQKMLDIGVWVQCDGGAYEGKVSYGTIDQDIHYSPVSINTAEPVRVVSLGGNQAHGLVRLIINDQAIGEAIINRGFPIYDNGKIVE